MPYQILYEYLASLRTYKASPSDLRRLQERKLKSQIALAYRRVPYYHKTMRDLGLLPADFNHLDDLGKLPVLTKGIIAENEPDGLLARGVQVISTRRTSGTTGIPTTFRRGPVTVRRSVALKLRRMSITGVRWWEKSVYLHYWGSDAPETGTLGRSAPSGAMKGIDLALSKPRDLVAGYRVLPIGPKNLASVSRTIAKYRPSILRGRPSYLRRIAKIIGNLDPSYRARRIFTEGEVLSEGTRKDLESVFSAEVFDEYGASEFSALGSECGYHQGIHLNSDYFAFEFLARDGSPAAEGERAEIITTGLMDDAMPLVRYKLGDSVVKSPDEQCRCGSYLPRLRVIEGRTSDGLMATDGELVPPGQIVDYLETSLGLRDFQLVQMSGSEMLLKVRSRPDETLLSSARAYLCSLLRSELSLIVEVWKEDEMPVKFRAVMRDRRLRRSVGQVEVRS